MTEQDQNSPQIEGIVTRVIKESQVYSNFSALDSAEQQKIRGAITQICEVVIGMRPDFSEDEVFNATADTLFTLLNLKRDNNSLSDSGNLN